MAHKEIVQIMQKHLPSPLPDESRSQGPAEEHYSYQLTLDQFEYLHRGFMSEVRMYAGDVHSYNLFSQRATIFHERFATFALSLGRGAEYHYVITGSFVRTDDVGTVAIWIKPTRPN